MNLKPFMFTHILSYGYSFKDEGWKINFIMEIVIWLTSYDRLIWILEISKGQAMVEWGSSI